MLRGGAWNNNPRNCRGAYREVRMVAKRPAVCYHQTRSCAVLLNEDSFMVRTQIQLTESQAQSLRKLANRYGLSVAELIRRGVDQVLASGPSIDADRKKRKAVAAAGRFRSGRRDVSVRHDHYLAEDRRK